MGVSQRLKNRFRKFLQRPGTTVDLGAAARSCCRRSRRARRSSRELDDAELTEAAGEADRLRRDLRGRPGGRPARRSSERPYDVQLLGAMALLAGKVAEMATGEGKTLTAAIAAYGHVRLGHGPVHVLTVNDYLARRDAEWMEPVYTLLGLTVGWVTEASTPRRAPRRPTAATSPTSRSARPASTTCATSWSPTSSDRVQRELATAIVDEADSILIDEARVPMVLAGSIASEQRPGARRRRAGPRPAPGRDYEVADDGRSVAFTDAGPGAAREEARRHRPVRRRARRAALRGQRGAARPRAAAAATSTTSCATARSSWSTRCAAGSPSAAAGPTGCRRRSRPRRA